MPSLCPNCRHADTARRDVLSPWVCDGCGAALRGSRVYFWFWGCVGLLGIVLHLVAMRKSLAWLEVAAGAMALAGLVLFLMFGKTKVLARGPCCRGCLYHLSSLPAGAPCPECGRVPNR